MSRYLEENKCAFIYLNISSIWYLKTSAWLNIQYLSVIWHHIAINIVWYLMFPFVMHFGSFFLENSKLFIYLRELIFYISDILFTSFVPVTFHRVSSRCCSSFTWLKPIAYPRNKSASTTKTRIILDWTIWNYYFYRSKCQMSAISYGLS